MTLSLGRNDSYYEKELPCTSNGGISSEAGHNPTDCCSPMYLGLLGGRPHRHRVAHRFTISRKTAHKWCHRWERHGEDGLQEKPRIPCTCPWTTGATIRDAVFRLRMVHPRCGLRKLQALIERTHTDWKLLPADVLPLFRAPELYIECF